MWKLLKYRFETRKWIQDSHPRYLDLQKKDPIYRRRLSLFGNSIWYISRYEDVKMILGDKNRYSNDWTKFTSINPRPYLPNGFKSKHIINLMSFKDDPDHRRVRQFMKRFIDPHISRITPDSIKQTSKIILDQVINRGKMDLISDYACILSMTVNCELLGLPHEDMDKFFLWTGPIFNPFNEVDYSEILLEFRKYFKQHLHEKYTDPGSDLLSDLVIANSKENVVTDEEMLGIVFLLLLAGHDTSCNVIANGMMLLLHNPSKLQELVDDPTLIESAVEEFLRLEGPIRAPAIRWAMEDFTFQGYRIKKGDQFQVFFSSANRDEVQFPAPDQMDFHRNSNDHLGFGHGAHYCMGPALGRLNAQIGIRTLIERLPSLRMAIPDSELPWKKAWWLREMVRMPVEWDV